LHGVPFPRPSRSFDNVHCGHKKHTKFFGHNLKKVYPILIIFGPHIHDTTGHQMAIQFPTLSNICFCTTWKKQNRQHMH